MHLAATGGSVEAMAWLVARGAKLEAMDKDHQTPLAAAAQLGWGAVAAWGKRQLELAEHRKYQEQKGHGQHASSSDDEGLATAEDAARAMHEGKNGKGKPPHVMLLHWVYMGEGEYVRSDGVAAWEEAWEEEHGHPHERVLKRRAAAQVAAAAAAAAAAAGGGGGAGVSKEQHEKDAVFGLEVAFAHGVVSEANGREEGDFGGDGPPRKQVEEEEEEEDEERAVVAEARGGSCVLEEEAYMSDHSDLHAHDTETESDSSGFSDC